MSQENYIIYLQSLSELELEQEIENKITDTLQQIINTEEMSSAIAETNACNWSVEDYDIVDQPDVGEGECITTLTYSASGEQDEEMGFCGSKITGQAEAVIDEFGTVTYQNVTAEVDDMNEGEDYDETSENDMNEDDDENFENDMDEDSPFA